MYDFNLIIEKLNNIFLEERKACRDDALVGFKPMPGTKTQVYDGVLSYTTDTDEKVEVECFYVIHDNSDLEVEVFVHVYDTKDTIKSELYGKLTCYGDNSFVVFRCKDLETGVCEKKKYNYTCSLKARTKYANSIINNLDGRRITYER